MPLKKSVRKPVKRSEKKKSKKKGEISAVLPSSPAQDYEAPKLHTVLTKIVVDDESFIPQYAPDASCVTLIANIEPDHAGMKRATLSHRTTVVIDCGLSMELSANYRAVIRAIPALANKGLTINESPCIVDQSNHGRICVTVTNVGKEIIVINHGDPIAEMYVEPVYEFKWVVE